MRFQDSDAWRNFVYSLLYPGVLGSMIYDVSQHWFYPTRILIVVLYAIDYLHLYSDLKPRLKATWWRLAIDGFIPLSFGFVYWSMTRNDFVWVFIGLLVIMGFVFVYSCPDRWTSGIYRAGKAFPLLVSLIAFGVSASKGFAGGAYACWAVLALVVAYGLHVFLVTEIARKQM